MIINTKVFIVGAGPTGLVLAIWLARLGIPFRIIDKNCGPGLASRAMAVHARTLEFYRQLGFADEVINSGIRLDHFYLRKNGKSFAELNLKDMGERLSPYPFVLCFAQDDHERLLVEKLRACGVTVEWGVELTEFTPTDTGVQVELNRSGSNEVCRVEYLCGCDGAHSRVRQGLKLEFQGGTYNNLFYVADTRIDGEFNTNAWANLGSRGFALMLPVRRSGMQRLIGLVPPEFAERTDLTFDHIRSYVEGLLRVHVAEVNWFATYHVHHRVAEHFQVGRCFIAGDAAHIHSPAGGQGMNTGIGDAVNLSWKLANVLDGHADSSLLKTYEPERIAFAKILISSTDTAFQGLAGTGWGNQFLRSMLIPNLMPILTRFSGVRHKIFKTISQIRINYHDSPLSLGEAGRLRGGDRLPWVPTLNGDNFESLATLKWQAHVYGTISPRFADNARELGLPVNQFPWSELIEQAGLAKDAVYLLRPDGHIAMISPHQNPQVLVDFVAKYKLRFR